MMTMNKTIWKQTDSRWGKKPYPGRGYTVGGCGCGLVACVHVAMEQERYKNWTPNDLRGWMVKQGFAVCGQGTKWEGITSTLKHIGHSKVVRIYDDPMSEAFKELNKGNRIGIILFKSNKAPNGIQWTSNGHYVAFTDYKVQDKKHYFYCKDSGGRNHDGWYTYENSMKGCVYKVWIVERIGAQVKTPVIKASTYKPTSAYKGTLPKGTVKKGTKGSDAKAVQTFLNWCINAKLKADGISGAATVAAIKVYQKTYGLSADGMFGPASKKKAQDVIKKYTPATEVQIPPTPKKKELNQGEKIAKSAESYIGKVKYVKGGRSLKTGCDCTGFVQAVHKLHGIELKVSKSWGKSVGKSVSKAKPGDVIYYYIGGSLHHMGIYVGNNKVVHNSTSHKDWHKDVCKSDVHMSGMKIGDIRRCWK